MLLTDLHNYGMPFLRYAIGVCCLLPAVLFSTRVRFAPRDVLPIALLGITQFGILIALLNYGLRFIPSGRAALIFATFPLLTMVTDDGIAGYSMAYGARFLKRVIDDRIKLPLSEQWKEANNFRVTLRDDQVVIEAVGPRLVAASDPNAIAV